MVDPDIFPRRQRSGFALVITLAIIVIVTLLVLSFTATMRLELQATGSYSAGYGASELAHGATDTLAAAFTQEIRTRSTVQTVSGREIFTPTNALGVAPEITVPSAARASIPTVVRVSSGTNSIGSFPPGLAAGGGDSSLSASGGRQIPTSRWTAPRLFPAANVSSLPSPEWIYWTRTGPAANPAAADVIGRFAFVAYNVGGLLNANVAGFPAGTGAPTTAEIGRKGSLALADLGQITGLDTSANADKLVRWREASSLPADWLTKAFERKSEGATTIRPGGNAFLSRQELIRYLKTTLGLGDSSEALLSLTAGSVFNQAPAFVPDTARNRLGDSGVSADNAGTRSLTTGRDNEFNPNTATLVWDADRTVNAGTPNEYTVKRGDPFVANRFDLKLLSLFDDPTANEDAIKLRFGLEPVDSSQPIRWKYAHNTVNRFRTLQELKQDIENGVIPARDPDFFEMLQAAIPLGSLGRDGGVNTVQTMAVDPGHMTIINRDRNHFLQILGIGASIIDQADADSYPTELQMPLNSDVNVCWGIENLPYLQRVLYYAGQLAAPDDAKLGGWLLFELWNPHQNPTTGAGTGIPSQLRVAADGPVNFAGEPLRRTSPTVAFWPTATVSNNFTAGTAPSDAVTVNMQTFGEPTLLRSSNVDSVISQNPAIQDFNNKIRGLFVGGVTITPMEGSTERRVSSQRVGPQTSIDIELQYLSPSGWRTYNKMENLADSGYWTHQSAGDGHGILLGGAPATYGSDDLHRYFANQRPDPRTDRFGALQKNARFDSTGKDRASELSMRPELGGEAYLLCFHYNLYDTNSGFRRNIDASAPTNDNTYPGSLAENFVTSGGAVADRRVTYVHPDGVRRRADSAYLTAGVTEGQPMRAGNNASRPVILNRPFRNVGELGYVFRGEPWSTLSFWTSESSDGSLLDYFTVGGPSLSATAKSPRTADAIDLNSAPRPVLKALLAGTMMRENNTPAGTDILTAAELTAVTDAIVSERTANGPFKSNGDMVSRLATPVGNALTGNSNQRIKTRREAIIRSLSEVANFRTWNLFIDVVAQTGVVPRGQALNRFVTRGERRLWVHVSLDRHTGDILTTNIEEVYE